MARSTALFFAAPLVSSLFSLLYGDVPFESASSGTNFLAFVNDSDDRQTIVSEGAAGLIDAASETELRYALLGSRIATVNLSDERLSIKQLPIEEILQYYGGSGGRALVLRRVHFSEPNRSPNERVSLIQLASGTILWERDFFPPPSFVTIDGSGDTLAVLEPGIPRFPRPLTTKANVYRVGSESPVLTVGEEAGLLLHLALSKDGSKLATLHQRPNSGSVVQLFDLQSRSLENHSELDQDWTTLLFSHDASKLYLLQSSAQLGRVNHSVGIWDATQFELDMFSLSSFAPNAPLALSPDGAFLVCSTRKLPLLVIDLVNRRLVDEIDVNPTSNTTIYPGGRTREQAVFLGNMRRFAYFNGADRINILRISSALRVEARIEIRGGVPRMLFDAELDKCYRLDSSPNLIDWQTDREFETKGSTGVVDLPFDPDRLPEFYRLWEIE